MPQVKKEDVRVRIVEAARTTFELRGYHRASMADIARRAGLAPSTLYVYFGSKFEVMFALYDPWLRRQLKRLEDSIRDLSDSKVCLQTIFESLFYTIPRAENAFSHNFIQALMLLEPNQKYSRALLQDIEVRIANMIRATVLPTELTDAQIQAITHLAMMAFDGFALNVRLRRDDRSYKAASEVLATLLLTAKKSSHKADKRSPVKRARPH
jgi:AcrR family transcriptional regulator